MHKEEWLAKRTELSKRKDRLSQELNELLDEKLAMDADEAEYTGDDSHELEERLQRVESEYEQVMEEIDELDSEFWGEPDDDEGDSDSGDEDGEADTDDDDEEDEEKKKRKHPRLTKKQIDRLLKPWAVQRRPYTKSGGRRVTRVIHPWELDKTSVRQTSRPTPPPEPTSYGGITRTGDSAVKPGHAEENWWLEELHETLAESDRLTEWEEEQVRQANEGVPDIDQPTGWESHHILDLIIDGEPVKPALFEAFKQWAYQHFSAEELARWEGSVWPRFHQWTEHLSHEQISGIHSAWLDAQNNPEQEAEAGGLFGPELLPGPDISIEPEQNALSTGSPLGGPEELLGGPLTPGLGNPDGITGPPVDSY